MIAYNQYKSKPPRPYAPKDIVKVLPTGEGAVILQVDLPRGLIQICNKDSMEKRWVKADDLRRIGRLSTMSITYKYRNLFTPPEECKGTALTEKIRGILKEHYAEDMEEAITDIVADLNHLAHETHVSWARVTKNANMHFFKELEELANEQKTTT